MAKVNSDRIGEEARPARVVGHVADRIDVDQDETVPTTTSITAVSVSMRSAQSTASLPEVSQLATGTISACSSWPAPTEKKAIQASSSADRQQAGGDELGGARADLAAEQAGDQEADAAAGRRSDRTCVLSPSSC